MSVKKCSNCKQEKPFSEFHKQGGGRQGLRSICKECEQVQSAAARERYRQENEGVDPFNGLLKRCGRCKIDKPRTPEHWCTNPTMRGGLSAHCLLCHIGIIATGDFTADLVKRLKFLWVVEKSGSRTKGKLVWEAFSFADAFDILVHQQARCPITGLRLTVENISPDHIEPLSTGGDHGIDNIRFTTRWANFARNTLGDREFYHLCLDFLSWQVVGELDPRINTFDFRKIASRAYKSWSRHVSVATRSLKKGSKFRLDRNGNPGQKRSVSDWLPLIEQQRGLCYLTGRPLLPTDCSVDHVVPLCKSGTNDFDNLKLCVKNANYLKADLTIDEMVPLCQRVVETLGNPNVKPRRDLNAEIQDLIDREVCE